MNVLRSPIPLGAVTKNIGTLFLKNKKRFGTRPAFRQRTQKCGGQYQTWTWKELVSDIERVSLFLFQKGLRPKDRIAFISANSYERLVSEMAVMSCGFVSVPIFAGYPKELLSDLLEFSDVKMLVTDCPEKIQDLKTLPSPILPLKDLSSNFSDLSSKSIEKNKIEKIMRGVHPRDLALIMYTSGTSSFPKGVELSHRNLLSQQKALHLLWKVKPGLRFLCYLPWHHSFGGLFERFFALHSGGCLAIDDSWGKNIDQLLKNFSEIKPHIYLSVPKVYQEIISRTWVSKEAESLFFHPELKFVFTAAAPLPAHISDIFKKKKIPVVEGWGLTETSPCCTLTEMSLNRKLGVVGWPMPDIEIKLAKDHEICVKGPNVMRGYFKQRQATQKVLDAKGWFKTGDIGEFTPEGLKLISRKDRIFKLNNGEKVFPTPLEENIKTRCKFIKHAYVFGQSQKAPLLLVFPNFELLSAPTQKREDTACAYPTCLSEFSTCLGKCLQKINEGWKISYENIQKALIIEQELTIEKSELTPSFKLVPRKIEENYKAYIQAIEEDTPLPKDAYVVTIGDRP